MEEPSNRRKLEELLHDHGEAEFTVPTEDKLSDHNSSNIKVGMEQLTTSEQSLPPTGPDNLPKKRKIENTTLDSTGHQDERNDEDDKSRQLGQTQQQPQQQQPESLVMGNNGQQQPQQFQQFQNNGQNATNQNAMNMNGINMNTNMSMNNMNMGMHGGAAGHNGMMYMSGGGPGGGGFGVYPSPYFHNANGYPMQMSMPNMPMAAMQQGGWGGGYNVNNQFVPGMQPFPMGGYNMMNTNNSNMMNMNTMGGPGAYAGQPGGPNNGPAGAPFQTGTNTAPVNNDASPTQQQQRVITPASQTVLDTNTKATSMGLLTGRSPTLLYMSCDDDSLSAYQCMVRRQIELFEARTEEVESNAQGRNKPIVLGQVGIRCRFCATDAPRHRARASVYYPAKLLGLYQAAQNMATIHLCQHCQRIPAHFRTELWTLRERKSSAGGGKKYWGDGARALGVFEAEDGLRFERR